MAKPFKLDKIKKVSRHETELIRALYEFLPATDIREKVDVGIRKTLMKHLGQDIRYYVSNIEQVNFADFVSALPEYPLLISLGLTPIGKKAFIQFDQKIANIAIDKLLGGSEGSTPETGALTETEQGVLQYLIMQVLSQVHAMCGKEARVHFRFEKFLFDQNDLMKLVSPRDSVCVMTIETGFLDRTGFVKLVFPYPFLEELVHVPCGAGKTEKERAHFKKQLGKWGFIKTSLWAEAGNALLSPLDMKGLETGDVVLFDNTKLKMSGKNISGNLMLRFGEIDGGVEASLTEANEKTIKCKMSAIDR